MKRTVKAARVWASWNLPMWSRRLMCRIGWHYWRYYVLLMGVPDITIRHCEDAGCGTVQDTNPVTWRWETRQGKGFGAPRKKGAKR